MEFSPRTALFVDLMSLDVMCSHHGARVLHGPLLERLTQNRRLIRAAAYAVRDDDHPETEQRLADLATTGFKVIAKSLRLRADGVRRASLGVDMAVDALELAPHLDALSLLTTDADFVALIEAVQRRGVRVEVVTSRELTPPALAQAADTVIEFESLLQAVSPARQRHRDLPMERGNARPRLDPPPTRRRQRRQTPSTPVPEAANVVPEVDTTESTSTAPPAPEARRGAAPPSEPAPSAAPRSVAPPSEPSPSAAPRSAAPAKEPPKAADRERAQAPVKVLPQENLTGRAVQAASDEA